MNRVTLVTLVFALATSASLEAQSTSAATYNLKVLSDTSPDLADLDSFITSTTSSHAEPRDKVWSLFYWSHILKRQTQPMMLHGFEVTDPIRNFLDYGFTMCSTISGINQTLYEALGLRHRYWDICNHTVSEVEYDGAWRMVDSSMSNLVATDDGTTLASVTQASADSARLVKERSLHSTGPNGFLTGSDAMRNLADFTAPNGSTMNGFADNFCSAGLKLRDYFYNWDAGHRYVLNLRDDESYTRYYRRLGTTPDYWVSSERVATKDPLDLIEIERANRFGTHGNGAWVFAPSLAAARWAASAYSSRNVTAAAAGGLSPSLTGQVAEVTYKIQGANAIASQNIHAQFARSSVTATAALALSLNHGATWTPIATLGDIVGSSIPLTANLRDQVNGVYETLFRIQMNGTPDSIRLTGLRIDTVTHVNVKALPTLKIGRNEIFVDRGDQSDTMVLWPELRGERWRNDAYRSENVMSQSVRVPRPYTAVAYPSVALQDAYLIYRMDAPTDLTRVVYGGRLHNFRVGSYIDFLHSFDGGASWIRSYRLSDVSKPWDVIHYETVTDIPAGVRTVLFKFLIHNTETGPDRRTGFYSLRMEANHRPRQASIAPLDVTWRWKEIRADRTTVERSHRQLIATFPFKYVVNVGGNDHPVMESIGVTIAGAANEAPYGYSDGIDAGGTGFIHRRQTYSGVNLAKGKPYTRSRPPSGFQGSSGDGDTTVLTDGVVGAPATGSFSYWWGQCWSAGANVDLTVDLGSSRSVGLFRAHLFGYPSWDALKGQVQDRIEVLTSSDGVTYASRGTLRTALWRKDIPVDHMLPDDEKATAWNFELTGAPVSARYVRYRMTPKRDLCASELQVLDRAEYEPFDMRIPLPGDGAEPGADPSVRLVAPAAGSIYAPSALVTLTADAADDDGRVERVDFLVNDMVVATDTTSPWAATWTAGGPGAYVLSAQAHDDSQRSAWSTSVEVTVRDADPAPDDVVLWAADARVAVGWTPVADATAAGGIRLQNPNAAAAKQTAAASPAQYFEMTFDAVAGRPYRLWIRGKATPNRGANDSVFVQFNGSVDSAGAAVYRIGTTSATTYTLEDCVNCGVAGWGWQDNGFGAGVLGPLIYFAQSGPQTIRIQVREDGLGVDQIVLSSARWIDRAVGALKNDTTILPK